MRFRIRTSFYKDINLLCEEYNIIEVLKMGSYEEWCDYECDRGITNREYINCFIDKYIGWVLRQKTISGNETRKLVLKDYTSVHRDKIMKMIYNMSYKIKA